ncbi:uncharacterized protein LOC129954044 isoform X2 [Eupeodes corollae]|nr:uncharacterized protein LOC129954044 isoform X2 [Eupeodes corollae]XP_055923656.1 uncharacterized protein LOC129954044 isoform X2 [Eupeodes corollae]XP_055923657.1 uncharacterized protein LOC129954044 isoform X2 [Eupeodes corollae]XP_055923658.1 uncharacterized protein LOC129954044 isoform X2 [Eupeodes corollae]XP_055923659.1 uncharacterized protein LOC129954044 isoform X2 [Eupeodes corollae]
MEKTPRYTQRERNMVLGFAAQYKDVIENKRTDAESNRKKDEVWRVIAKEFNCRVYHQRSAKQLRQLYKNMKLLLKKDLCNDSKNAKSFMDILEALSQQDSINQYLSSTGSPSGYNGRQPAKMELDVDNKMMSGTFDSDVIVIKAEDISDNDQSSSVHNGDMEDDDDDDCLSTKDIPEVCLEEEDEELFSRPPAQSTPDLAMRNNIRQTINNNYSRGNTNEPSSPTNRTPSGSASNKNEFLLNLAIEERKRKIDLLNAQIEYWKTLTRKLEITGHSSCPCHIPKMNGHHGQS